MRKVVSQISSHILCRFLLIERGVKSVTLLKSQSSFLFHATLWFLQSKGSRSNRICGYLQECIEWRDSHYLCARIFFGARQSTKYKWPDVFEVDKVVNYIRTENLLPGDLGESLKVLTVHNRGILITALSSEQQKRPNAKVIVN
jgi:hypothetical protein